MLCLTLKRSRWITLKLPDGTEIRLHGVDPRNLRSRIGIEAPLSVQIVRSDALVQHEKPK